MQIPTSILRRLAAVVGVTVGVTFLATTAAGASASRWATLEAIHRVENPNNSTKPGPRGELGAYQFRSETWRHHTSTPFNRALDRQMSDAIAIKHYDWIRAGLTKQGIEASVYNIALAWNAGIGAVTRGSAPRVAHDYASRVSNIALDLHARNVAAAESRPAAAKPARKPAPAATFVLRSGYESERMTVSVPNPVQAIADTPPSAGAVDTIVIDRGEPSALQGQVFAATSGVTLPR